MARMAQITKSSKPLEQSARRAQYENQTMLLNMTNFEDLFPDNGMSVLMNSWIKYLMKPVSVVMTSPGVIKCSGSSTFVRCFLTREAARHISTAIFLEIWSSQASPTQREENNRVGV